MFTYRHRRLEASSASASGFGPEDASEPQRKRSNLNDEDALHDVLDNQEDVKGNRKYQLETWEASSCYEVLPTT